MPLPVIAITNQSTVLTDSQVEAVLPALQKQVSDDFKAYWDIECSLTFLPKDQPLIAGWWQIAILDDPDQADALGYHELSANGLPLGKIFARLDLDNGYKWTVTFSHELLEMLADPWIAALMQAADGTFYALEVCDAVEADHLGYDIHGVAVSDFITPSWYEPTHADRVDFKRRITKPGEIALGGYMSVFDPQKGWIQIQKQTADRFTMQSISLGLLNKDIPVGSRRHRRTVPRNEWRRSER